jgi:hypothetical protein
MGSKPSFDMARLSTGTKVLLGAALLLFIDMLLPWNRICEGGQCLSTSGWNGIGVLLGILVLLLLIWEGATAAGVNINVSGVSKGLVSVGLAGAVALFTLIRVLVKPSVLFVSLGQTAWAWIGLILGVVVAVGGFLKYQEERAAGPGPAPGPGPDPGGPFTT